MIAHFKSASVALALNPLSTNANLNATVYPIHHGRWIAMSITTQNEIERMTHLINDSKGNVKKVKRWQEVCGATTKQKYSHSQAITQKRE